MQLAYRACVPRLRGSARLAAVSDVRVGDVCLSHPLGPGPRASSAAAADRSRQSRNRRDLSRNALAAALERLEPDSPRARWAWRSLAWPAGCGSATPRLIRIRETAVQRPAAIAAPDRDHQGTPRSRSRDIANRGRSLDLASHQRRAHRPSRLGPRHPAAARASPHRRRRSRSQRLQVHDVGRRHPAVSHRARDARADVRHRRRARTRARRHSPDPSAGTWTAARPATRRFPAGRTVLGRRIRTSCCGCMRRCSSRCRSPTSGSLAR